MSGTSLPAGEGPNGRFPGRLGIYLDDVYWVFRRDGRNRVSTDRSFLLFVCEAGEAFESLSVFGRAVSSEEPADYVFPEDVHQLPLPH